MNPRYSNRLIGILVIALFCYLGLYAWNARTGYLDTIAERTGLEIVAYILSPVTWVRDQCADSWNRYMALIDVADENARLRAELKRAALVATLTEEERQELARLRSLLQLPPLRSMSGAGARVIAARFGPQSVLQTLTVNKGFVDGATVGTPVIAASGVVGKVLRASPHASTVLLVSDPGFRVAVISQQTRTPGIATGAAGHEVLLDINYVAQNAKIQENELLVTAGVDGLFPKGIPVGIVTRVRPGDETLFQQVEAVPLVNLAELEEVVLLHPQVENGRPATPLLPPLVGPPDPMSPYSISIPASPASERPLQQ